MRSLYLKMQRNALWDARGGRLCVGFVVDQSSSGWWKLGWVVGTVVLALVGCSQWKEKTGCPPLAPAGPYSSLRHPCALAAVGAWAMSRPTLQGCVIAKELPRNFRQVLGHSSACFFLLSFSFVGEPPLKMHTVVPRYVCRTPCYPILAAMGFRLSHVTKKVRWPFRQALIRIAGASYLSVHAGAFSITPRSRLRQAQGPRQKILQFSQPHHDFTSLCPSRNAVDGVSSQWGLALAYIIPPTETLLNNHRNSVGRANKLPSTMISHSNSR